MAYRTAVISRHVIVPGSHSPVYAVILIESSSIHDIVLVTDPLISVSSLISQYSEWQPEDFEHSYVSPGLIDLNVQANGQWEGLAQTSRAAVSGGVTFMLIEAGLHGQLDNWTDLCCDIGKVEVLDDKSEALDRYTVGRDTFALKTYLFPPSSSVTSGLSVFPRLLSIAEQLNIPLFVDSSFPSPRMLFMASPCRFSTLEERTCTTTFTEDKFFAGAFPEDLNPDSGSSDNASPPRLSLQMPLFPGEKTTDGETPGTDWHIQVPSRSMDIDDENLEKPLEILHINSTEKVSKRRRSAHLKTIYEDLRSRIEKTEESIEDLSRIEQLAYTEAGETRYALVKKRSMSIGAEPIKSGENSGSRQTTGNKTKRKRPRPLAFSSVEKKESRDHQYIFHLANHPDHWESNGVEKVLSMLETSHARIHFCNLSSARAINKVLNRDEKQKNVTVEISPNYLFFSASSVSDGDTRLKSSPPVRNKANCNLLWDLLKLGQIDIIASHHQPIPPAFKPPSFKQALPGITCIGFTLQALWTKLCSPASSSHDPYIVRLSKWLSTAPATLLNISSSRGSITKGKFADLVIWKPSESFLGHSLSQYPEQSPYHGVEMRGSIQRVYVRGHIAFNQGEFRPVGEVIQKTSFV